MMFGLQEDRTDFCIDQGDEADGRAVIFQHPDFSELGIDGPHVRRFGIQKRSGQKRVSEFAGGSPDGHHDICIVVSIGSDHRQRPLS